MIKNLAVLRVARPTDRLDEITTMYVSGLGFQLIGSFKNHDGFDGSIIGHPNHSYHLEFTQHCQERVGKAPTQDNLLVFYLPNFEEWKASCESMKRAGFKEVRSFNSYWDQSGKSFEDIDGYRVVLQNEAWTE
ncbi:VOC family protein [Marinobacter apostichopi]|uniref:VOC family protein n=1 Tax=Marinobacter apostichopi TaxID=3035454 RepID=UPI00257324B6|nr:VOC family protein [Marinobacter sp. LA51]